MKNLTMKRLIEKMTKPSPLNPREIFRLAEVDIARMYNFIAGRTPKEYSADELKRLERVIRKAGKL